MLIIAFPFAGGNKYSYGFLRKYLGSNSKLITLEYPGRGKRISEPLLDNIPAIVEDAFLQIKQHVGNDEYVIYGHSMGGLVSSVVCKLIEQSSLPNPARLVLSGCLPPKRISDRKNLSELSSEDFWDEIKNFNGTPSDVFENKELRELFEPILRKDIYSIRTYEHLESLKLQTKIKLFFGEEEVKDRDAILEWQEESLSPVDIEVLPGNHFFILEYGKVISKAIEAKSVEFASGY